ncbi:MAG: DMT family transporter [Pseudodesulfovibrio sp.]
MTTSTIKRMGLTEWSMLIALSILWGGSFFFNEIALRGLPPLVVVWGRLTVGALGLVAVIAASSIDFRPYLSRWRQFLIMGVLNTFIPFSLIVWGQQHIDSGLASVINATTPAFTILIANFFTTDERASMRKFGGAILGLGGVATLIGADGLTGMGNHFWGQAAILGATSSYACAATYARRLAGVPPMIIACGQLTTAALVATPVVFFLARPWELPFPGLDALGAVIGLGLACSALAYILFFRILAAAGATNVQLVTLLIPFSASALGITILGEPFTWRLVIGICVVTTAALIIDGRLKIGHRK